MKFNGPFCLPKKRIPRKITDANSQHELKIDKNNKDKIKTPFNELEMNDGTTKVQNYFYKNEWELGKPIFKRLLKPKRVTHRYTSAKTIHHHCALDTPCRKVF